MLGLAGDVLRQEMVRQKAILQFADRIEQLRRENPELLGQIGQAQGIGLASVSPPLPRRSVSSVRPRVVVSRNQQTPVVRGSTAFASFITATDLKDPVARKRVILARKMAPPWFESNKITHERNVLSLDIARRIRKGGIGGGGPVEVPAPEEVIESADPGSASDFPMLLFAGGAT